MKPKLYYEVHVTMDYVGGADSRRLAKIADDHQFRVAKFIMQKAEQDCFCTYRSSEDLTSVIQRMREFMHCLKQDGFVVRRYKIEDTVLDSKMCDELDLLT